MSKDKPGPGFRALPSSFKHCGGNSGGVVLDAEGGLSSILSVLSGIAVTGGYFSALALLMSFRLDVEALRARVQSSADNPALEELIVVAAAVASLVGIVFRFVREVSGEQAIFAAVLGISAVFAT